jgi:uncharacterized protein
MQHWIDMDITLIESIANQAMEGRSQHTSREPGWLFYHGRRTGKIAIWLAEKIDAKVDLNVLYTGGLFHDVAKGSEMHSEAGAQIASDLLTPFCSTEELAVICQIIRRHNQRGNTQDSLSVKLVQDADLIDHVGLIGTWLAFYWNGSHNESIQEHLAFINGEENERYRQEMRQMLNFEVAQEEFDRRIQYEDNFFSQFQNVYFKGMLGEEK